MTSTFKSSASVIATVSKTFLKGVPNIYTTQQKRTHVILQRMYPLSLAPKGKKFKYPLTRKAFIYEVIEDTIHKPAVPIDLILTQYIEGVGDKGDMIKVKPLKAYKHFLLPGLAVYNTPENIEKYLNLNKELRTYSSKAAPLTLKCLSSFLLIVSMSVDQPWTLQKWHIKANFRNLRVCVPEEAITMPDKEIKGPNIDNEGKEFYVTVTINKTESIKVRCKLHHVSTDLSKQLDPVHEFWKIPGKAIFEEDQEILDSMPRSLWETAKKKTQ